MTPETRANPEPENSSETSNTQPPKMHIEGTMTGRHRYLKPLPDQTLDAPTSRKRSPRITLLLADAIARGSGYRTELLGRHLTIYSTRLPKNGLTNQLHLIATEDALVVVHSQGPQFDSILKACIIHNPHSLATILS